jgi:dTMP kinase
MGTKKIGKFIVVEGIDGSGKTNIITAATKTLENLGIPFETSREPGGTEIGEDLRRILKEGDPEPVTEVLLFAASFCESLHKRILPKINQGIWIVSDRWFQSTIAYQCGGRGVPRKAVEAILTTAAPKIPDLLILCQTDPETARKRTHTRGQPDRFDRQSNQFMTRVANLYEHLDGTATNTLRINTAVNNHTTCAQITSQAIRTQAKI